MRTIRIVSDGVPIEIYDDIKQSLEEATEYITQVMKTDTVVTLVGKNSSAIVRPSSVSAISIFDSPVEEHPTRMLQKMDEAGENGEQKTETVDEICDLEK
jgi:hypothetical protein